MEENTEEVWRPVVEYEGLYEVSNIGRVRSLPRKVCQINRWGKEMQKSITGRVLSLSNTHAGGYLKIGLCKAGKKRHYSVHALVLTAFVGAKPGDDYQARHLDGNPKNNRVENLCWGTAQENAADRTLHGNQRNARKTHCDHGHEFTVENTYINPRGHRDCKTCRKLRAREHRQRNLTK